MSSNLYNVLSGIINNERCIITGLQNLKVTTDRIDQIIVTSGNGAGFLTDSGAYVSFGSNTLAPVVNGKIPAEYLPSYVDDVIEGYFRTPDFYTAATGGTKLSGETGKLYLDLKDNKNELYRWSGSAYVKVSGLNGNDLLAIDNKITYVSGVVSGIHVYNSTITVKNGTTSLGSFTTNQNEAGTIQLSSIAPGAGTITLKNGSKTSANTFTVNESSNKSVDIAALFDGYATGTINDKTITIKNGTTTLGSFTTNQSSTGTIQLSSMLNGYAQAANVPTVNDVAISFKNGSLTAADTFTTNASSAKAIQLSGILSGLALKSSIPTVYNKTVAFKNGSTTIGTLSTNQSASSEINFSSEFDKKQDVIDSSHKLDYSLVSSQPTIPSVGNATITFKNGSTSLGSFTTNQSGAGTIQLSSLVTAANDAIGNGTITVKNGASSVGNFTVNQSGDTEINLSGEFNKKQNVIDSSHKLSYTLLSSAPSIPAAAGAGIITIKNGAASGDTFTANEGSAKTVQLSALWEGYAKSDDIKNSTITLKNGVNTIDTFTLNASSGKTIQLSSLVTQAPNVGDGTITLKNGSTSIGSFTVNQSDAKEINLSGEFNKKQNVIDSSHKLSYTLLSSIPSIPTVNNNTITLKNGSTIISSFTLNQNSDKEIDLGTEFNKKQNVINSSNKLAYSNISGTPSIYNSTITLVNGSTSGDSFTVNTNAAKNVQLSALFAEYATNTDLSYVSGIVNGLQAQSNPEGTIAAFGEMSGNIVTAANPMSNGYFVTSTGTTKTVEGKTYSRVETISSPTHQQIPTAKAVSGLVSGMLAVSGRIVANAVKSTNGTGTTAGQLIISTGTQRDIKNSSISSGKLVLSDGTGTTANKLVITTSTENTIISSSIGTSDLVQSAGTGTTAGNLVLTTGTDNKIISSLIASSKLVQSDGTGSTAGQVVVTTDTANKVLSSNITATNIVTAANNMTSSKIVTATGNKTIEGATLSKVTTITSGRTDNDIPTAKAVYEYTSGKVSANDTTITIRDNQAGISDSFTTNASTAKTIELSGMFAKRECMSAVFPTATSYSAMPNQWVIALASGCKGVTFASAGSTAGTFIKVTVNQTAITAAGGSGFAISGQLKGQNGATWGTITSPLYVDIPETLTFVYSNSYWNLIEVSRL